jgi:hypothetical protein
MLPKNQNTPNLKTVAERVGLAPCSVSSVLNNAPAARAIPQATKDRIFRAAAELNYRPNFWARSLRTKRTRMVAVVAPDIGLPATARVIAAAQERLHRKGYLLVLARLDSSDSTQPCTHFQQTGIEGVIAIDATLSQAPDCPVAAVDLTGLAFSDSSESSVQAWLCELGKSAAESITQQIESKSTPQHRKVEPKMPLAYFDRTSAVREALPANAAARNDLATW